MDINYRHGRREVGEGYKSDFADSPNSAENKDLVAPSLGQRYPQQNPTLIDPLGEPMTIREVARVLGCSVWTVRQRYLPRGLPYLRLGSNGKLLFYRNQVVRWVLEKQKERR